MTIFVLDLGFGLPVSDSRQSDAKERNKTVTLSRTFEEQMDIARCLQSFKSRERNRFCKRETYEMMFAHRPRGLR